MAGPVCIYGNPTLRKKARRVETVDDAIRTLADRMLGIMVSAEGIGLAAEQIGRDEALFVLDIPTAADCDSNGRPNNPGVTMPLVLINPEIIGTSDQTAAAEEGCLSFPGLYVSVTRPAEVVVRFLDRDGKERTLNAKGLLARAVQHELDHLNGVLLVDHMSPIDKLKQAVRLQFLRRRGRKAIG